MFIVKLVLNIRQIWHISNRLKSNEFEDVASAIKRLNRENKLLFGKLLENYGENRILHPKLTELANKTKRKSTKLQNHAVDKKSEKPELIQINKNSTYNKENVNKNLQEGSNDNDGDKIFPLFNEEKKKYSVIDKYVIDPSLIKPCFSYPSVSVILNETLSKVAHLNLEKWKKNLIDEMGEEDFQVFQKLQLLSGSLFREQILKLLKGTDEKNLVFAGDMLNYWKSLKQVFPRSHIKDTGRTVVHSKLKYKGVADCLIEYQGKLMLVNWKKMKRYVSSVEKTFDFPLQVAAYIGAINYDDSYPFQVKDALLIICYSDGSKADIFHLNAEKCLYYWRLWLKRLCIYRTQNEKRISEKTKKENETVQKKSENNSSSIDEITTKPLKQQPLECNKNAKPCPDNVVPSVTNSDVFNVITNLSDITNTGQISLHESRLPFPLYNTKKSDYIAGEMFTIDSENRLFTNRYPAVTYILNETKSKTAKLLLEQWKRNLIAKLGIEGFETYQKNLLLMGSDFHMLIQQYLSGVPEENLEIKKELLGCWTSLKPVFPLIKQVKCTESKVVHEQLKYKGIIDCVAEFKNKLVLIDWKKSERIKSSVTMTYDAPLQVAAYTGAINFDNNYPFKVEECLLIISYTDGSKANLFHINKEDCFKYWNLWLERLNLFKKNSSKIEY